MAYDPTRVYNHILDIINATSLGFGGAIEDAKRSPDAINNARIQSGWEILAAVAANPENGHYGPLAALFDVAHNAYLPAHEGEPGIPVIVPFSGADAREGEAATPQQIDSWRSNPSGYTGALDGVSIPHNEADDEGRMSPLACRFSILQGRFKFTGFSAQVPMVVLTRTLADTGVPEAYEPTVVKLSIPKLVKPGDLLAVQAPAYGMLGERDLEMIRKGALNVPPIPLPRDYRRIA